MKIARSLIVVALWFPVSAACGTDVDTPTNPVRDEFLPAKATGTEPSSEGSNRGDRPRILSSDFNVGDVFVGVGDGAYQRYTNDGMWIETIRSPYGGFTTGCALDASGRLYTSGFTFNRIIGFERAAPHDVFLDITTPGILGPEDTGNESIVFDALGNMLIGHAGGGDDIHLYSPDGMLLDEYDVFHEGVGADWIDLASDGCTVFYSAEERKIRRFDICARIQLDTFATLPGVGAAFAIRLLSTCTASGPEFDGMLVADARDIKRLDSAGMVVATYDTGSEDSWFALNLDPSGESFWSADFATSRLYRFNIASGAIEVGPIETGSATATVFGLCVLGELTTGTEQCSNGVDDNCDGYVDCADAVCSTSPECSSAPPTCAVPVAYESACDSVLLHGAQVSDPNVEDLLVEWSCEDPSITIDPPSIIVMGGPGSLDVPPPSLTLGVHPCGRSSQCTLRVEDQVGQTSECVTSVLFDDDVAPTFASPLPTDQTVVCRADLPPMVTLAGSDNCDASVTVTASETPFVGSDCAGSTSRTWTATDDCGNTASHRQTLTVRDDVAPIFTPPLPSNVVITCSSEIPTTNVTASDSCDPSVPVSVVTGPLEGSECKGTIARSWTATDDCDNQANHLQTLTVVDSIAPSFSSPLPGDATVACSTAIGPAETLSAIDLCDATVDVSVTTSPLAGTECRGSVVRSWTAMDDCGNSVVHRQSFNVRDVEPPMFVSPLPVDIEIACGTAPPPAVPIAAVDGCDSAVSVTVTTSTLQGAGCDGAYTRTWMAADDCGNAVTHVQTIRVRDTNAPVFVSTLPSDVTVPCGAIPPPEALIAEDDCDLSPTVSVTTSAPTGDACDGTVTRTWTATDACGNATSHTQTITLIDRTPPVLDAPLPVDLVLECGQLLGPESVTATDDCDLDVEVVETVSPLTGTLCAGSFTRSWTAIDSCGNDATHVQTIAVGDHVAPVFTSLPPADVEIECGDDLPIAEDLVAVDDCHASVDVVVATSDLEGTACDGVFARTWTATDGCGNDTVLMQQLQVRDTSAPIVRASLEPLPAQPATSASSVCSAPARRSFDVVCGGSDDCGAIQSMSATIVVVNSAVTSTGVCEPTVEEFVVECGSRVDLELRTSPCPAQPRPARPAATSSSTAVVALGGEAFMLKVSATDACGNVGSATFDPSQLCETTLGDEACCPVIEAPQMGGCELPRCDSGHPLSGATEPPQRE